MPEPSGPLYYIRNPSAAVMLAHDRCIVVRADGSTTTLEPEDPDLLSAVLRHLQIPLTPSELAIRCGADEARVVAVAESLVREQAVLWATSADDVARVMRPGLSAPQERPCRRLVVGISGSLGAAVMLPMLVHLRQAFAAQIDVIVTESARRFLVAEALGYFGFAVWTDPFATRDAVQVPHMHLATVAELVLVMPASARTLHRLATGECSDLLSLVVAATEAPVVVAPSMNERMHRFPAIRRNLERLRADGMYVVEPALSVAASEGEAGVAAFQSTGLTTTSVAAALRAVLDARHRSGSAG